MTLNESKSITLTHTPLSIGGESESRPTSETYLSTAFNAKEVSP